MIDRRKNRFGHKLGRAQREKKLFIYRADRIHRVGRDMPQQRRQLAQMSGIKQPHAKDRADLQRNGPVAGLDHDKPP